MGKMDALHYEYLIRRAHQCGRYGVKGANADVFRGLERAEVLYRTEKENQEKGKSKQWNKTLEELAFDYGKKSGEVSAYINTAIKKVLNDYENKLTDEQKEELENCEIELIDSNISKIENVIEKAQEIMIKIELFPK